MPQLGIWTPQEIADELKMPRQFVLDVIVEKRKAFKLPATKIGRSWAIVDADAQRFIEQVTNPQNLTYSPNDLAKAIGKSRKYILDQLTGYGGRKEPRLAGVKRGGRWVIAKWEAERFIGEHGKEGG